MTRVHRHGSAPSLGRRPLMAHLLMAHLPPAHAVAGTALAVEYLGERYPVSVAAAGATPLFDPPTSGSGGSPPDVPVWIKPVPGGSSSPVLAAGARRCGQGGVRSSACTPAGRTR